MTTPSSRRSGVGPEPYRCAMEQPDTDVATGVEPDARFDHLPIQELPLSVEVAAVLGRHRIATVGDLRRCTRGQLSSFDGITDGALGEVEDVLASCGLGLSPSILK